MPLIEVKLFSSFDNRIHLDPYLTRLNSAISGTDATGSVVKSYPKKILTHSQKDRDTGVLVWTQSLS